MKVLIIGGGGREHTLVWKIAQSPLVEKVYCVPGNAGIAVLADCRSIALGDGFKAVANFAEAEQIGLTVVGPENPLAEGIVDVFRARGLRIFGPDKRAAILEASKDFAKQLMVKHGIPTAVHRTFDDPEAAIAYIEEIDKPVFVKADGLAAGKGAIPGLTRDAAVKAVRDLMVEKSVGNAGEQVVIEEAMFGEEASFTVLTDGTHALPLATSQDHKMSHDGDKGKNTGGMGAYSPAPVMTAQRCDEVMETIVYPTLREMQADGRVFKGVLYVGLMVEPTGTRVVEFNCRFGDPEAQVILPRMRSDLVPLLEACIDGTLSEARCEWREAPAACVVMASGGYPDAYETGKVITGLDNASALEDVIVFHAGTQRQGDAIVTAGGRALGVTALGHDIKAAIDQVYRGVEAIHFDKAHYRRDIGHRALNRQDL